jgi:hypothetical protein
VDALIYYTLSRKGMSLSSQTTSPPTEYDIFLTVFEQHFSEEDVQLIRQLQNIVDLKLYGMRGD